jgi:mono/diheme cytochrome c family protein
MKLLARAALGLLLGAAAVTVHQLPAQAQAAGVFTAAQADQGAKLYGANCAACHSANLSGGAGPALAGAPFMKKWTGKTADDIHGYMSSLMPMTAPGSLKPAEYLAITAFILQKNGYPAGTAALDAAKLKSVAIKAQ